MATAGKLTRRDSENKLDVKVTGELGILITGSNIIVRYSAGEHSGERVHLIS